MVNKQTGASSDIVRSTTVLIGLYVVIAAATVVALAIMAAAGSASATGDAWIHAVIVGLFAVLLPLRLRSARREIAAPARAGRRRSGGLRAVMIIAAVLVVVNVVEALIPGLFPTWMRIEMGVIAILLVAVVITAAHAIARIEAR